MYFYILSKLKNLGYIIFLLIISTFILNACTKSTTEIKKPVKEPKEERAVLPIKPPEGSFSKVGGWLNDHTVIYVTNTDKDASNVYKYDLFTGKSKLMYHSPAIISTVSISPNQKYVLIQSSQSRNEGDLTVLNLNGDVLFSQNITSFQLALQWNQNDDRKILVTSFNESWEYKTYILDIGNKTMDELTLEQPFAHWFDDNKFIYLDWNDKNPTLLAPIVEVDPNHGNKQTLLNDVFQLNSFQNMFLAISVDEANKDEAIYTFFTKKFKKIISINMPHLSKYSDWLVPFNDFNSKNNTFITFRPISSGEADVYKEGFQLVSYQLGNGKEEVLFDQMKNEPISCSPNGKMCLYGNQFEKLFILNEKKIVQLVPDSK